MNDNRTCIKADAQALRFRWIDGQCFEIVLPGGTHILTDPFYPSVADLPEDADPFLRKSALDVPFGTADLERVDYVILNHTHFDHILQLQEVVDRFHPVVVVHSSVAVNLADCFDIPLTEIYPVDFQGRYHFPDFVLETWHGMHHPVKGNLVQETERFLDLMETPEQRRLSALGGMVNLNFLLITPENLSMAFVGGDVDGDQEVFARHRPTILLRNKLHSSNTEYDVAKEWSDYLAASRIPLMVPMHHEKWLSDKPGYTEKLIAEMNERLRQRGSVSRVLAPQRTRWYGLGICVEEL